MAERIGDYSGERDGQYGDWGYYRNPNGSTFWRLERAYTPNDAATDPRLGGTPQPVTPAPVPSPVPGPGGSPSPPAAQTPEQIWQAAGVGQGAYTGPARTVNGVAVQPGDNVVFDNGQVRVFRGGSAQPVATQRPGDAGATPGGGVTPGGGTQPGGGGTPPAGDQRVLVDRLPVEAYNALAASMNQAAAAAVQESNLRGIVMRPVLGPDASFTFEPVPGPDGQPIPTVAGQVSRAQIEYYAAQAVVLQAEATGYVVDPTTQQRIQTPQGALRQAQAALTQAQSDDVRAGRLTENERTRIQRYTAEQNVEATTRQLDLREQEIADARRNGDLERANRLEVQAGDLRGRLQLQQRELDTQVQLQRERTGFEREVAGGYLGGQRTVERERVEAEIAATQERIAQAERLGQGDLALRERTRLDVLTTEQARLAQQESQFGRDIALRQAQLTGRVDGGGLTFEAQKALGVVGGQATLEAQLAQANLAANPRNYLEASFLQEARGGLAGQAPANQLQLPGVAGQVGGQEAGPGALPVPPRFGGSGGRDVPVYDVYDAGGQVIGYDHTPGQEPAVPAGPLQYVDPATGRVVAGQAPAGTIPPPTTVPPPFRVPSDQYGQPQVQPGRVYAGGSARFDENTGQYRPPPFRLPSGPQRGQAQARGAGDQRFAPAVQPRGAAAAAAGGRLTYSPTRQTGSIPVSAATRALVEGTPIPKFGAIAGGRGGYVNEQQLGQQFSARNIRTADYLNLNPSEQAQTRAVASRVLGKSDEDFQAELQANLPKFRAPRAGRVRAA